MFRRLEGHKVNGCNEKLEIGVVDEPGAGGASHRYDIVGFNAEKNPSMRLETYRGDVPAVSACCILFQNGPIPENGTNGVTHEALIAVLIDRLEGFQSGKYATVENQIALDHLRAALGALKFRTEQRVRRGVEGTHKV